MALLKGFEERKVERPKRHVEANATFSAYELNGERLLQIDSYGSVTRQMPGKTSQSVQIDEAGARQLLQILRRHFDLD